MLQNPSKYHTNPLSHFLALHNSQAAHNARNNSSNNNNSTNSSNNNNNHLTNISAFGICGNNNSQFSTQQQQQAHTLQQEQLQQQQQRETHNQLYNHHLHQHNNNLNSSTTHAHQQAQFLDATVTTLDVGKSFTIAAILGLQNRNNNTNNTNNNNHTHHSSNNNNKNNHNKDLTNAINLSLNGNQGTKQTILTPSKSNIEQQIANKECIIGRDNNINPKTELIISTANKFHCDNNTSGGLVNSYLTNSTSTTSVVTGSTAAAFIASAAHQQHHHLTQNQHHPLMPSHVRANSFAAAAAVAAVAAANVNAVVNGAPTALQSLQQLHQHHAQQSSLSFARDKLKSEHHTKKSSMKNKRVRTIFTPEQLERLEGEFERQQYMVGPERLYLAHTLQLTEAQVKVWFQNRRIKWRKHHLELTQQRLALLRQNQLQTGTIGPNMNSLPSPEGLATAASNSSFDDNEELNIKNEDMSQINAQISPNTESESELSVCNDSMDADSVNDGGGNT